MSTTDDEARTLSSLAPLFRPRAVAVVGASRDPQAIGHIVVRNLVDFGFTGAVHPVNPRAQAVRGIRCVPTLDDVPDGVDLAVLVVPAEHVPAAVEACGRRGIGAAIIISAGFKESGPEGAARELRVRELAAKGGVRLIGPNCMGVIDTAPDVRLNASFAAELPLPGNVAFASQSGALGEAFLAKARELDLSLSAFVSLGNKADVGVEDLLAWWEQDARTRVILLYLEGIGDPARFARLARRITRAGKAILAVKSGRSDAGARASASHTGALAGTDEATSMLLEQCGVIRVTRVEGLFNLARAFSRQPLPRGRRAAIVSNAGGPGIMAADAASNYGLQMATLSAQTTAALKDVLPPAASTRNPVDTIATATPQAYGACVGAMLADPQVDALLPIYVGPANTDVRRVAQELVAKVALARQVGAANKPVLACVMGGRAADARAVLAEAGIPAYDFPEDAAQALGAMARAWATTERDPGRPVAVTVDPAVLARVERAPAGWLPIDEAFALLAAAGLRVTPHALAATPEQAASAAERLGWPVVLKWDHPELLHKSDKGGVILGLRDRGEVLEAARTLADRGPAGGRLLVQAQVKGGRELILGARRDPAAGALVLVGLGGVHAEVLRDTALRVLPLTDRDARDALDALRGAPLLAGHRGEPALDRAAAEDALLRLAALVEACPRLAELDVNPLFLLPRGQGAVAVDVRVRLA